MSALSNTFTLERFNGVEKYRVAEASIFFELDDYSFPDDYYLLEFTVRTESPAISHSCEDTKEWERAPNIEVKLVQTDPFPEDLTGFKGKVLEPYDDNFDEVGHIYYFDHMDLRDISINFLEKNEQGKYRVSIIGHCDDVNNYDGSASDTKVMVDAWFDFSEDDH